MAKRVPSVMRRARAPARVETRGYANASGWLVSRSQAGVDVTPDTSLNFSAVYAAINCIASDVASLPCLTYAVGADGGKVPNPRDPLFDLMYWEPNDEVDAFHFESSLFLHALTRGDGIAEIVRYRTGPLSGQPAGLHLIEAGECEPVRDRQKRLMYQLSDGQILRPEDVLHLKGLSSDGIKGISPVTRARQSIGLGMAAELYGASYFGNGAQTSGFLKTAKNLTKETRENLREEYNSDHGGPYQAHKVGILVGDYEWVSTSLNPDDSQFLQTREFSIVEIARWFNINPIKLMDYTHGNYSNVESANLDYVTTTLVPWLTNWESELNRKLIPRWDRGRRLIKHDVSARLRGDSAARMNYYRSGFGIGILSQNEIRRMEDLNPIAGGDEHYIPGNNMVAIDGTDAPDLRQSPRSPDWVASPRRSPEARHVDAAIDQLYGVRS